MKNITILPSKMWFTFMFKWLKIIEVIVTTKRKHGSYLSLSLSKVGLFCSAAFIF